jgi:hypothetical protein
MNNQENPIVSGQNSFLSGLRSYHKNETSARNLAALPLLTTFPLRSIKERFLVFLGQMERKTTAMKIIGISTPSGEAVVAGYNVKSATEMVKKSIGYMSQNSPCMMT